MGFKLPDGADLSVDQMNIINLSVEKNWLISGGPGTGKTVMAIYRADQANLTSKEKEGKPVLMLVYNKPLQGFLSTALDKEDFKNIEISTYHHWLKEVYTQQGWPQTDLFTMAGNKWIWNIQWNKVQERMGKLGRIYFHVVIDESQDFPIELLEILSKISEHMTCFFDPNQAIEDDKTNKYVTLKMLCEPTDYKLTRNFRNTIEIQKVSALYCINGTPAPSEDHGKKPVITQTASGNFDELNKEMAKIIEQNKEKEIGIIVVNQGAEINTYKSMRAILPKTVNVQMHLPPKYTIDFNQPGVKILTYGTMKGLEFDIVLLPLFDKILSSGDATIDANRVYVATSRAISELYLYYWSKVIKEGKINTMTVLTNNSDLLEWK
ncbi:MAG: AAA family ATPase [Acidaminococcus sp.]|nr:AAA family ATPase [Acidaminococcus sp.]MCI2101096.1 AAA family ATPase [Acidaminococcus sp.]MCI2117632.1 AAA family ATPase [Acidaminococcus sp.]